MLVGLLYAKKHHDDEEAQAEDQSPLLMPQGEKNPLTDRLMYDDSEPTAFDSSRASATQGVSMRQTSRDA